jgi:serralysin
MTVYTWQGPVNGDFADPSNWPTASSIPYVPGPNDFVAFAPMGPGTISGAGNVAGLLITLGSNWTFNGQIIAGRLDVPGMLSLSNGATLVVAREVSVQRRDTSGTSTPATVVVNAGAAIYDGNPNLAGDSNVLTVGAEDYVGSVSGSMLVLGRVGLANHLGEVGFGLGSHGNLTVASGGMLSLRSLGIGSNDGAGTVTVTGTGSQMELTAGLSVIAGDGKVIVSDHGGVVADFGAIGYGELDVLSGGAARFGSAALAYGFDQPGLRAQIDAIINVSGSGSQLTVSGSAEFGSPAYTFSLIARQTGSANVTNGGYLQTGAMTVDQGYSLTLGTAGLALVEGDLSNFGTITTSGVLRVLGHLSGAGSLAIGGGLTDFLGLDGSSVNFLETGTGTLRAHGLSGATTVSGMGAGDAIDLAAGITGVSLSGNTVSTDTGSITLAPAPSGYEYRVYGDAAGGTQVLLHSTSPSAGAISLTPTATSTPAIAQADDYAGPVDYLRGQYIWSDSDGVAMHANVRDVFLKGGSGDDALQVQGGNNVLDGGNGSNFLVGGNGWDGGMDTFFIDGRGAGVTWSSIVNFHQGDQLTIWGSVANQSTQEWVAWDGASGYQGLTVHSELGGAGTGVNASATLAGLSMADLPKLTITTGNVGGNDYMLIQYTG